jgi:acyl dehydratase
MTAVVVSGIEEMRAIVGRQLGPTGWRSITQAEVDAFADLSGDHQWIHVDPERARIESPFGGTIVHGNLTLATADGFRNELLRREGFAIGLNYGWNKVRFPTPVPVGSRIRGRAEVISVEEKDDGWFELVTRFTLALEGAEKPCFVGDSVTWMKVR